MEKEFTNPRYKLNDVVFVAKPELMEGRIYQGIITHAELLGKDWFYTIKIPLENKKYEEIYSYEENTGDAKTKFIHPLIHPNP